MEIKCKCRNTNIQTYTGGRHEEHFEVKLVTPSPVWLSERGVGEFDENRREWLPVALTGALWLKKSVTEGASVLHQDVVEWVEDIFLVVNWRGSRCSVTAGRSCSRTRLSRVFIMWDVSASQGAGHLRKHWWGLFFFPAEKSFTEVRSVTVSLERGRRRNFTSKHTADHNPESYEWLVCCLYVWYLLKMPTL